MRLCVCLSTSREHRRYFYVNDRTSASQWDFPVGEDEEEGSKTASTNNQQDGTALTNSTSTLAGTDYMEGIFLSTYVCIMKINIDLK